MGTKHALGRVAFEAAVQAFDDLSSDEQFEWVERLKRRYPRLDRVADG